MADLLAAIERVLVRLDAREPELRALVPEPGRRRRLLDEARALLEAHPRPDDRPPLFGLLVGVKDIFSVDGLPTRAGSALPPEEFAGAQASAVTRLRAAGALVLGKTVTTEFAFLAPAATTNPHDPRHTPGGSSSGSAAAVADGYVPLALGSQTVGSLIRPAAFCGIVGFKPSYGRLPCDGMLPFSESVDCPGLLCADVETAIRAASVLIDGWAPPAAGPPRRLTLGVPDGPYLARVEADARTRFERQLVALQQAGHALRRVETLADIEEIGARHYALIAAEFARAHAARFARFGALYSGHSAAIYDAGRRLGEEAIAQGRASARRVRAALEAPMDALGLDAWVSPAAPGEAPAGLHSTGDAGMNMVWTHAHMPAVAIPAGRGRGGLPLGLQLCARVGADEALLAVAGACADALAPLRRAADAD